MSPFRALLEKLVRRGWMTAAMADKISVAATAAVEAFILSLESASQPKE